ncbi:anthranilate synthase/aminodeoxychorismate synthase-like glutamine amidotransferase [Peribacillus deserti]|uniref:Anthranilate synthase/aminodeoxychorismate synthase-like glutamine amidotransferase n=1 Tax=Peribacillus deserti TaxID=673318 RepID=A0ABS2QDE1_9BACI|nr:aminodeoxychorismate/anthranilate synthase component II [Peribacillus deserti]MBM7691035.1 anthranilate synthase/aminodeoxychorismate synthase-like glutamine amidotransferase [Peribacillus deserti]
MILLIDNYDSFTYNLYQYVQEIGEEAVVKRNNEITIDEIKKMNPDYILLSPGPGNPDESGVCLDVIREFHRTIPILGICLGHQAIARAFGGRVIKASRPMHGKVSRITHDRKTIFKDIPDSFSVTRYHSLIAEKESLPDCLEASAIAEDGEIMAIRHKTYQVEGLQFHPESIMSEHGHALLKNFFNKNKMKLQAFEGSANGQKQKSSLSSL